MLTYENTMDFLYQSCPSTLLSSYAFYVDFLAFITYKIMSYENEDSFIYFLPTWMTLFFVVVFAYVPGQNPQYHVAKK